MSPIIFATTAYTSIPHLQNRQPSASSSLPFLTATSVPPTSTGISISISTPTNLNGPDPLTTPSHNSPFGPAVLVGIILGAVIGFLLILFLVSCACNAHIPTTRSYTIHSPYSHSRTYHLPRGHRHHVSFAVSFPACTYSSGSTSSSESWRQWQRDRERDRERNRRRRARWMMMDELYDRDNGFGLHYGHRGILNGGWGGWRSPRGYGMERHNALGRGTGLGHGLGSPRLGEGLELGLGAGRDTLGAGIHDRERFDQPLGGFVPRTEW